MKYTRYEELLSAFFKEEICNIFLQYTIDIFFRATKLFGPQTFSVLLNKIWTIKHTELLLPPYKP